MGNDVEMAWLLHKWRAEILYYQIMWVFAFPMGNTSFRESTADILFEGTGLKQIQDILDSHIIYNLQMITCFKFKPFDQQHVIDQNLKNITHLRNG